MIARVALATFVVTMAGACRGAAPHTADRATLGAVSLPDLTSATAPVQAQLRQQYAALTQRIQNADTAATDLADAYGDMGKLLMAAEFRDGAETCLLNAQTLAPDAARWPYYLGHLHKLRGETLQSIAAFERALALQPGDLPTLVWLGDGYLDQGRPDAAEPLFARASAQEPRSVPALFGLGRAALDRSDYTRAVERLERALALDPQASALHYPLALAYRGLGDAARTDLHMRQRAPGEIRPPDPLMLDLDSLLESAVAYEVRGAKALDERDWKRAALNFRKGLDLAPTEPSLHHKLGTALYLDGDPAGAAEQFELVLRLSPHFAKAHYSLGIMHGSNGRSAQAIEHLSAAVRDDPTYADARLRLADVLRASGRPAESLPHYERAAALDPRRGDAPFGSALALVALGRYRDARDRLQEGMTRYPDHRGFGHALIRLLAAAPDDRVRDGTTAMRLLRERLAREPRQYDLDEMMAMAFAELGQYGDAVTWQRDAIAGAERSGRSDAARHMRENLSRYQHNQPCRTPWRSDDPWLQ